MKNFMHICTSMSFTAALAVTSFVTTAAPSNAAELKPGRPVSAACTLPTAPARTREETAWQIFVAVNCQQNGQLAWESWTEQTCWTLPDTPGCNNTVAGQARKRFLHGSAALANRLSGGKTRLANDCLPMLTRNGKNPAPASLSPFLPANLSSDPLFCEEVMVNEAQKAYILNPPGAPAGVNLLTLTGQAAYVASNHTIDFDTDAVAVKANWLPADALASDAYGRPAFDCRHNKPHGVYVEQIEGKCYALVAMHISSKLYPKYLWATFEPQNKITNPNRCNPNLYSACNDPWGSVPAGSTGRATGISHNLARLMKAAGLPPEFANYRMVGAQTEFDQPRGTLGLGNSFTEYNFAVAAQKSSCITCHSYAAFNTAVPAGSPPLQNTNLGPFPDTPAVGQPGRFPNGDWKTESFSWLLGFMPAAKTTPAQAVKAGQ